MIQSDVFRILFLIYFEIDEEVMKKLLHHGKLFCMSWFVFDHFTTENMDGRRWRLWIYESMIFKVVKTTSQSLAAS